MVSFSVKLENWVFCVKERYRKNLQFNMLMVMVWQNSSLLRNDIKKRTDNLLKQTLFSILCL